MMISYAGSKKVCFLINTRHTFLLMVIGFLILLSGCFSAPNTIQNPPREKSVDLLINQQVAFLSVANKLKAHGFFADTLISVAESDDQQPVRSALRKFQQAKGLSPTGQLDEITWNLLKQPLTVIESAPPLPEIQAGSQVFAIERSQCLYPKEGWILMFAGEVNELDAGSVSVNVQQRYSLRYDAKQTGVSSEDWFCAPKRRVCYSQVEFDEWGGELTPGQLIVFDKLDVMHRGAGFVRFASQTMKKVCPS